MSATNGSAAAVATSASSSARVDVGGRHPVHRRTLRSAGSTDPSPFGTVRRRRAAVGVRASTRSRGRRRRRVGRPEVGLLQPSGVVEQLAGGALEDDRAVVEHRRRRRPPRGRGSRAARRARPRSRDRWRSGAPPRRADSTTSGARPMLISSISSTFGCWISARAMASICCSPPESAPAAQRPALLERREHVEHVAWRRAAVRAATLQVLLDGERREQAAVVGHEHHAGAVRLVGPAVAQRRRRRRATVPSWAGSSPARVSSSVVLPAPLGPSRASDLAGLDGRGRRRGTPWSSRSRRSVRQQAIARDGDRPLDRHAVAPPALVVRRAEVRLGHGAVGTGSRRGRPRR